MTALTSNINLKEVDDENPRLAHAPPKLSRSFTIRPAVLQHCTNGNSSALTPTSKHYQLILIHSRSIG